MVLPDTAFLDDLAMPLDAATVGLLAGRAAARRRAESAELAEALAARGAEDLSDVVRTWSQAVPEAGAAAAAPDTLPTPPEPESWRELALSSRTSPYRLWAAKVERDMLDFAYWSYVAAHAAPEARRPAEDLARASLAAAAEARRWRRRAYRDERGAVPAPGVATAEATAERHLQLAETARDETALNAAQAASGRAIEALSKAVRRGDRQS